MIIKKIDKDNEKADAKSKRDNITDLILYIARADGTEEVLHSGGRNFMSDNLKLQIEETVSLAQETKRSAHPFQHWVMSWQEDEVPQVEHFERAVDVFLEQLGLQDHLCYYGAHKETDNLHLHLLVNMVNPNTLTVARPGNGFDYDLAHKAIAILEHEQGWKREKNGKYSVLDNGMIARKPQQYNGKRIKERVGNFEARTGQSSAQTIGIRDAAGILENATSWTGLQEGLAQVGIEYVPRGSGAVLRVGNEFVKVSDCSEKASHSTLVKKLGDFAKVDVVVAERKVEMKSPISNKSVWEEYILERSIFYKEKRELTEDIKTTKASELKQKAAKQKELKKQTRVSFTGDLMKANLMLLQAAQAIEDANFTAKYKAKYDELKAMYGGKFPDFEEWLITRDMPQLAHEYRHKLSGSECSISSGGHGEHAELVKEDIRSFSYNAVGKFVYFYSKSSVNPAFIDRDYKVDVLESHNEGAMLAALQLGVKKFGTVTINGNDEFKADMVRIAVENNLESRISNLELQEQIEEEMTKRKSRQELMRKHSKTLQGVNDLMATLGCEVSIVHKQKLGVVSDWVFEGGRDHDGKPLSYSSELASEKVVALLESVYTPVLMPKSKDHSYVILTNLGRDETARVINSGIFLPVLSVINQGVYSLVSKVEGSFSSDVINESTKELCKMLNISHEKHNFGGIVFNEDTILKIGQYEPCMNLGYIARNIQSKISIGYTKIDEQQELTISAINNVFEKYKDLSVLTDDVETRAASIKGINPKKFAKRTIAFAKKESDLQSGGNREHEIKVRTQDKSFQFNDQHDNLKLITH